MAARRFWWWTAALAAACAVIQLHPVSDPDTFWHLTLGRAVLSNHARSFSEPAAMAAFARTAFAPEWLWEIINYWLFKIGGYHALSIFLALVTAGSAVATALFIAHSDDDSDGNWAPFVLVSTATMMVVLSRIILRPQAAYLILLPLFLFFLNRYARETGRARAIRGVALVAIAMLWAQLHGSFILAPALFFILLITRRREVGGERRTHLLVGLGLAGALLTSAYGASVFVYVIGHSGGDGVRHIEDMRAPAWSTVTPAGPFGAAWLALALLSLAGLFAPRKPTWYERALSAFGLVLFLTANRFIDASAILTAPLALRGARAVAEKLPKWRLGKFAALAVAAPAVAAAALIWFAHASREWWGPIGITKADESKLPIAAAAALRALPAGQNVLSSYEAGGPLGFLLDGHARTFVDGRTPLFFDDTEYAVARDLWFRPRALANGLARYGITAVVAPRDSLLCRRANESWTPIDIEYGFTTFVPKTGAFAISPGLTALAACGDDFIPRGACTDGGAALKADIDKLDSIYSSPFTALLRAEMLSRCNRTATEIEAALPSRSAAWSYENWWRRLRAHALATQGSAPEALALVEAQIADGDLAALNAIFPAVLDHVPLSRLRRSFERLIEKLDDDAPSDLRVSLALLCVAQADAECVRFQATRAAADGNPRAAEPLRWLAEHHPQESARADAAEWLKSIQNK